MMVLESNVSETHLTVKSDSMTAQDQNVSLTLPTASQASSTTVTVLVVFPTPMAVFNPPSMTDPSKDASRPLMTAPAASSTTDQVKSVSTTPETVTMSSGTSMTVQAINA